MKKSEKEPQIIPPLSNPPMTYKEFYEYWVKKYPIDEGFELDFEYALYLDPLYGNQLTKSFKNLNKDVERALKSNKIKTIHCKL